MILVLEFILPGPHTSGQDQEFQESGPAVPGEGRSTRLLLPMEIGFS